MEDGRRSYDELAAENLALRERGRVVERRVEVLQAENVRLQAECVRLRAEIQRLTQLLENERRAGKRQAAPFAKGTPKENPRRPGRKPGEAYGEHQRRAVPERIDETIEVPLPPVCPKCGGKEFKNEQVKQQYQVEIPRTFINRQFDVHCGHCVNCGCRVQGRHPLQTSDALGAAKVQLGPNLQAAIAITNKELGLTHGKIQRLFGVLFDLKIARSTIVRAMLRAATKLQPAYDAIVNAFSKSDVTQGDETGWRVNGVSRWLNVFVAPKAVLYVIGSRGREVLASLIGLDYDGTIVHDGYVAYDGFEQASHQQCLFHLLKRCRELLEVAVGGARRFPQAVKDLLQKSLAVRDDYFAKKLTLQQILDQALPFTQQLGDLAFATKTNPAHERFAKFLRKHVGEIFTFLCEPDHIPATNCECEFETRFNVIARKLSGGNRSDRGVIAQQTLPSVIRTCRKLGREAFEDLVTTLTTNHPPILYTDTG